MNSIRIDLNIAPQEHLASVVARLKNLGISDEEVLSAAWLHDTINDTQTSFDEIDQRFGSRVAVIVLSISKDKSLSRSVQEEQYVKQLRESPLEAKTNQVMRHVCKSQRLEKLPVFKDKKNKGDEKTSLLPKCN